MSARVDHTQLPDRERETRRRWLANATRIHARGVCGSCGHVGEVARQPRRREFECIGCWEFGS